MSVTAFFKCKKTIARLHTGPLSTYIGIYADRLVAEGHCYQSGARGIRVVADYSAWLASKQQGAADVNEDSIKQYEQFRKKCRRPFLSDHSALNRLLIVLREANATAPLKTVILEPLEQVVLDFEQYQRQDRGLCETSSTAEEVSSPMLL